MAWWWHQAFTPTNNTKFYTSNWAPQFQPDCTNPLPEPMLTICNILINTGAISKYSSGIHTNFIQAFQVPTHWLIHAKWHQGFRQNWLRYCIFAVSAWPHVDLNSIFQNYLKEKICNFDKVTRPQLECMYCENPHCLLIIHGYNYKSMNLTKSWISNI